MKSGRITSSENIQRLWGCGKIERETAIKQNVKLENENNLCVL